LFRQYERSPGFGKLSVKSKQAYIYCAKRIAVMLGDMDVAKMRRSTFIQMQADLKDTPALANLFTRISSIALSYGVDLDIISANPVAGLKSLKTGSHEKWNPEEVRQVIALSDRKISTAVALAWYTGQREGDILSMRWSDYKDGYISLAQQKTGQEMKLKVHPDLEAYLDSIRGTDPEGCFIVSGERPVTGGSFRTTFGRKMKSIGINKTFHGIRKGVACSLAENGRSVNEIAAILGHKTIRMAAYYADQANGKKLAENAVSSMVSCL
jgi:integrase